MSVMAGHQRVASVVSILVWAVVDLLMRDVSSLAGECQLDVQQREMRETFVLSGVRVWLSG